MPGPRPAVPPFRLTTFATLSLTVTSGRARTMDQSAHRRRLAFLAVLAAAGERGRSRDELLLLFWPDVSQRRARHSLEQLLYGIRTSLNELVFAGVNPIRLNPDIISSDLADFESALTEDRLGTAVELYNGPFLAGFYLGDSPEFEQWADSERRRLEERYADALEQLADAAERANDHALAVKWRRNLAGVDPLSSRRAIGLMRALENGGDLAAALQYAERYQRVVARELGTSAGPDVAAYVAELRARASVDRLGMQAPPVQAGQSVQHVAASASVARDAADSAPESAMPATQKATTQPSLVARSRFMRGRAKYTAAVLSMALAGVVLARAFDREPRTDPWGKAHPSLVVLPLVSTTSDGENASFADAMTLEIIGALANISGLRVIASTSAFAFQGRLTDVRKIADSLGVTNVLEGSIQRTRSRIRLSVRLIDASDGATRWSETYDRQIGDMIAVQVDIGRAVATQLAVQLAPAGAGRTVANRSTNSRAYDWYLRGRYQRELRSDTGFRGAIEAFSRAVHADSAYAPAYAGLAEATAMLGRLQTAPAARRRLFESADSAARRAVALDDLLPEAHLALGAVRLNYRTDFAQAEVEWRRAVALNPGDRRTHEYLALLYGLSGRPSAALSEAEIAVSLDPLSVTAIRELARALYHARRYDEALAQLERARTLGPPLRAGAALAAQIYAKKGLFSQAIREVDRMRDSTLLGYILARAGKTAQARTILRQNLRRWRTGAIGAYDVAVVYVGLGEHDEAFAWIEKAFADGSLRSEIMGPPFDDLRADARFRLLARRMGLQNW